MKPALSPINQDLRYPVQTNNTDILEMNLIGNDLVIRWGDDHLSRFNAYWLRDNCPSGGDKLSAIRSFVLRDMNESTRMASARLNEEGNVAITWENENLISSFTPAWLRAHCYETSSRLKRKRHPVLWNQELQHDIPHIDYRQLALDNKEHLRLLEFVVDYGFAHITHLPRQVEGIEVFSDYLALFTENDFGRVFDLISEPNVWDLSQSSEALDPHTDDPYRYSPPGIRILYCVEASKDGGGQSEIVNGISVCEHLRQSNPRGFELLSTLPVPHIRYRESAVPQVQDVHLKAEAKVINLDREGEVCGFRFHERSMATLDLAPELMEEYYQALIQLSHLVSNGNYSVKLSLQAGEAIVFDNQLVMHGRSAFDGALGRRHLRLCQMDRDLVHSRFRLLLSHHNQLGAGDIFSSGVC